ncbi:hypothetical protein HBA92_12505 [Ochrobactrum sp. MR28]|nr:hypothetical protein [Ochrobactrum sp. MR28]MBX8816694.1 hypothetical protein [Ochrobactrum sp. MR31]
MTNEPEILHQIQEFEASKEGFWGVLAEIEAVLGREKTLLIAQQFGGGVFYLPKTPSPEKAICKLIGVEATQKLITAFNIATGVEIDIPHGPLIARDHRRRVGIKLLRQGQSLTQVANSMKVSRTTVKNWKRRFVKELL